MAARVTSTLVSFRRHFSSAVASFNLVKRAYEHGIHKIHLNSLKTR